MSGDIKDILNKFPLSKKVIIFYEGSEFTCSEILTAISHYENHLREIGVKQCDIVGIMLPNSPAFIYGLFSVWKIGAIAVPINILLKKNEIEYILEHSGMKAIISESNFSEMFSECGIAKSVDAVTFLIPHHSQNQSRFLRMKWLLSFIHLGQRISQKGSC